MVTPIKGETQIVKPIFDEKLVCLPPKGTSETREWNESRFNFNHNTTKLFQKSDKLWTPPTNTYCDPTHKIASAKMEKGSYDRSISDYNITRNVDESVASLSLSWEYEEPASKHQKESRLNTSAPAALAIEEQSDPEHTYSGETRPSRKFHKSQRLEEIKSRKYTTEERKAYITNLVCHSLRSNITPEMQKEWQQQSTFRTMRNFDKTSPVELSFETVDSESPTVPLRDRNLNRESDESVNSQDKLTGGHLLRPSKQLHYGK